MIYVDFTYHDQTLNGTRLTANFVNGEERELIATVDFQFMVDNDLTVSARDDDERE